LNLVIGKVQPGAADANSTDISSIALQGLEQANVQADAAAAQIAGGLGSGDVVDLSAEMIALMQAKTLASASMSALTTADQMQQSLVDVTA
jgi:flagellar basal body rod protein FlgG